MPDNKINSSIELKNKAKEFEVAMSHFNSNVFYRKINYVVSIAVIILQLISIDGLYNNYKIDIIDPFNSVIVFLFSYVMTDFINGLIHMYMDNNVKYSSVFGPFIAAFHLHHKKPIYKRKSILRVYFDESGAKYWLPVYLALVIYLQNNLLLSFNLNLCLTSIGILSSIAEVSHYLCHNSKKNNVIINILQKYKILLPKEHHKIHHCHDNVNYAFLNGVSDPVINIIASVLYDGYKNNADKHVMFYTGPQTNNR